VSLLSSSRRYGSSKLGDELPVAFKGGLRLIIITQQPKLSEKVRIGTVGSAQGKKFIVGNVELSTMLMNGPNNQF